MSEHLNEDNLPPSESDSGEEVKKDIDSLKIVREQEWQANLFGLEESASSIPGQGKLYFAFAQSMSFLENKIGVAIVCLCDLFNHCLRRNPRLEFP